MKLTPHQKAWTIGSGTATVLALALLAGAWAFVISALSLLAGVSLGVMAGAEISRRSGHARADTAEAYYAAAVEVVDRLNEDNAKLAERAESAERDLLAATAEKTKLRAQLDKHAGNAA
ncbi:hypothetical protein [Streptosporangium canum]|uniref:hypothetical protein n=1 Tax=Streptosporangium canum TaxID=324952 RepID=UPI0037AF5338